MKDLTRIVTLFSFFLLFSCTSDQVPPNILFIAIDDLKPTLGCYGDEFVRSPNIDQVASRGTVFLNNHCQYAVCGPSRASLLTGLYPDQNKVWGFYSIREQLPDVVTLPQHFKQHGYTTVNISKIFDYRTVDRWMDSISWSWPYFPMGGDMNGWYPEETGPVAAYFYQSEKVKKVFEEKKAYVKEHGGNPNQLTHQIIKPATECLDMPDDAYKDGIFARKAIEDMEKLAVEGKPFFLAVGFERPHLPFTAPKPYWDLYDPKNIELASYTNLAENDKDYYYTTSNELRSYTDEDGNDAYGKLKDRILLEDEEQRYLIQGYLAAVTYIDAQVGLMLEKLDELGLKDNTIVVIWGDHGWHLGDHGIWGKNTNFEQSTRSPLIISAPWIKAGVTNQPVEFVDLFPTLCDLANIPYREGLAGTSLQKIMRGEEDETNMYAYSQQVRGSKMGYAIRDEQYRFVLWLDEGRHENPPADYTRIADRQLFDYEKDPLETINVAGYEAFEEVEEELYTALQNWLSNL